MMTNFGSTKSRLNCAIIDFNFDNVINYSQAINDDSFTTIRSNKRQKLEERTVIEDGDAVEYNTLFKRDLILESDSPVRLLPEIIQLSPGFKRISEGIYKYTTNFAELKFQQNEQLLFITGKPKKNINNNKKVTFYSIHVVGDDPTTKDLSATFKLEIEIINQAMKKLRGLVRHRDNAINLQIVFNTLTNKVYTNISYHLELKCDFYNVLPPDITEKLSLIYKHHLNPYPTDIHPTVHTDLAIGSALFYHTTSENTATLPDIDFDLQVPELEAELLKFQKRTVNWLLHKESVEYDVETGRVKNVNLIDDSVLIRIEAHYRNESIDYDLLDHDVGVILNRLCFGWKRFRDAITDQVYWINFYTGNSLSRDNIYKHLHDYSKNPDKNECPQILPGQGLLAEEMGLGKTVETTALVLLNQRPPVEVNEEFKIRLKVDGDLRTLTKAKTTLIVAPESILKQWYEELSRLAPSLHLTIYRGMGKYDSWSSNARVMAQYLSKFDIVLTTYGVISRELDYALYSSRHQVTRLGKKRSANTGLFGKSSESSQPENGDGVNNLIDKGAELEDFRSKFQLSLNNNKKAITSHSHPDYEEIAKQEALLAFQHSNGSHIHGQNSYESPLMLLQFWRVLLDEVQMVSSSVSRAFQSAELIPRFHAWGVSGTPIKKNFDDLHSVLKFLRVAPFNFGIAKYTWEKLKFPTSHADFIALWSSLCLRHTKYMVRNDLKIPPQKRTLITTPFTIVEQENYNQKLEECLSEICLDLRGNPVTDDWAPTPSILSNMRTWLVKLRQVCGNPQIGNITQGKYRYKSKARFGGMVQTVQQLKTLEKVLDDMIRKAFEDVNEGERKILQIIVEIGQFNEYVTVPSEAIIVLSIAATETERIVHKLKLVHTENVSNYQKTLKQLRMHSGSDFDKKKYDDDEDDDDMVFESEIDNKLQKMGPVSSDDSFNVAEGYELLAKYKEEKSSSLLRLRSWLITLHKIYFLLASSHFQVAEEEYQKNVMNYSMNEFDGCRKKIHEVTQDSLSNADEITSFICKISVEHMKFKKPNHLKDCPLTEDETEKHKFLELKFYDLAEDCRRVILNSSIKGVAKAVSQRITSRPFYKDGLFLNDGTSLLSKSTRAHFDKVPEISIASLYREVGGVKSNLYLKKVESLINQLNRQAEVINKWTSDLVRILCKPLFNEGKSPDGEEYEESLLDQGKVSNYLQVIPRILVDRSSFTLGEDQAIRIKEIRRAQDRDFKLEMERRGEEDAGLKELEEERNLVKPTFSTSLQDMVTEIKDLEAELKDSKRFLVDPEITSLEIESLKTIGNRIKNVYENEKLAQVLLQKEITNNYNAVFNSRIEYFKQLQSISDSVKPRPFSLSVDEIVDDKFAYFQKSFIRELDNLNNKMLRDITKSRYLLSLTDVGVSKDDDLFCIICRSTIIVGTLTACGHKYCKDCLEEWLKRNPTCPTCKARCDRYTVYHFTHYKPNVSAQAVDDTHIQSKVHHRNLHSIYRPLEEKVNDEIQDIVLKDSYGSKVDVIVKQILNLKRQDPKVQVVVFSQWQDLLIILGTAFKSNGISFVGSRGTLIPEVGAGRHPDKYDSIEEFKNPHNNITCFLLNAKAQASGLTLVNATHIFMCEPLVNTSLELQAISRIHRIGQKHETTVWMFAIENSVEESIVLMSTNKRLRYIRQEAAKANEEEKEVVAQEKDLSEAESMALMQSDGNASLVGKHHGDGEEVTNADLWDAFFCAKNESERPNPMTSTDKV